MITIDLPVNNSIQDILHEIGSQTGSAKYSNIPPQDKKTLVIFMFIPCILIN
jgi:predicted AlkP superfamily pyrophosphatase or phosphodiesterase